MTEKQKVRFIMRVVMTEYMILMAGALLLYAAVKLWPNALLRIAVLGGAGLAAACVIDFLYLLKTGLLASESATKETPRN